MSVNAYRVIRLKTAEESTFNVSHDDELREFLEMNIGLSTMLNEDRGGLFDVPVEVLEEALMKATELHLDQDTGKSIRTGFG